MSPLVAKVGGSLWRSPLLSRWIAALAAWPGPSCIVPGGGPFADAVRAAQGPMRFSERAAHEMALIAMEQYGIALCDLFGGLALAATPREAAALRAQGRTPVWRPRAMALEAALPACWDVTSDSLAAWYARESGAPKSGSGDLLAPAPDAKPRSKDETNGALTPISRAEARVHAAPHLSCNTLTVAASDTAAAGRPRRR